MTFALRALGTIVLASFSAYTVHASRSEPFWPTARSIWRHRWGRQVTADLYIGLLLFTFFVWRHEGSALRALLWFLPSVVFGNIVPLIYFVLKLPVL